MAMGRQRASRVYAQLHSAIGKTAMRRRGQFVERFDRGGMRRNWLRERDDARKRYQIHVCGFKLGS